MAEFVKEFWAVLMGAVAFVVWLVRLEGRAAANQIAIKRLEDQRKEDLVNSRENRKEVKEMLEEMRGDIKDMNRHFSEFLRGQK